ncbi:MAG TPA: hypothetical protein VGK90_08905 [Rhizomicrobium sp.]
MTAKIPVERTITGGYGFAFRNFFSVLGIVWFPYLALLLVSLGLVRLLVPDLPRMIAMQELDMPALMSLTRLALLVGVLAFITGCIVTVGLQRKALGLHSRPVWFYFSLGAPVWRMAGAFVLAGIAVFLIALLTAAVGTGIWFAAGQLGGAAGIIRVLDICAGVAFLIYIMVRLLFFLPAVVVAEGSIGLERAWILGGHNFWRILIVTIAVFVPVAVVFHILSLALFGSMADLRMGADVSAQETLRALMQNFAAASPAVLLFQLIERIVLLGLTNGAVAYAYRAASGTDPAGTLPATVAPAA